MDEVVKLFGVMLVGDDYLLKSVREECERIVFNIDGVKLIEVVDVYFFLKIIYKELLLLL